METKEIKINRLTPVLSGAFLMTIISILPLINIINLFFCAGIILGGFYGVFNLNKQLEKKLLPLTYKDGILTGILSGILSSILVSGFNLIIVLFSNQNPITDILKMLGEIGITLSDDLEKQFLKFSGEFNKYGFSPTITIFSFISNLILYPLFGSVGSSLGVSFINKKRKKF